MKYSDLDEAIQEANRFLKKAEEAKSTRIDSKDYYFRNYNAKESGAVRRSSMDLTRALSKLRNG